ncbi:putative phosphoenolpyruvate synthase isoform X2 [Nasonia vitripennis]|uniref:Phosphoenolpyruvate synthase n=1 Tax=Nasonia vitripennis TaxID=7425 RepID=A0A7M7QYM7_NASVI|nr:putative phosphoenolpyruvate synthase isoform X2 [Nasonia vitripennis]XP_032456525.1 putative phosphoenolpyruvate synthase isoform X2 [Nasonia vitripennis]
MEVIYGFFQILALFLTTLWFFTWLCERRSDTGWLFERRRQLAVRWIARRKRSRVGLQSDSNDEMDKLVDGVRDRQHDSNAVSYYGADLKNNFVFVEINYRQRNHAEVSLFLGLEDGRTYELADHPNTVTYDFGTSSWSAAGLKISVLESGRRARIIFNGLLRKGNRSDINRDSDADVEHVCFNCIFVANARPISLEQFWTSDLRAGALAQSSWKKSKWQQLIDKLNIDEIDQYGSLVGQLTFENSSSVELYLRGVRQCCWGKCDAVHYDKRICITGFDAMGVQFRLNLADFKDGLKNVKFGHVKDPTDNLHPITAINFDEKRFFGRFDNGFNEYSIDFTAGGKKYEAIVQLHRRNQRTLYGGYPWDSQYYYCNFELKLNDVQGVGMIQLWKPYSGACPVTVPSIKRFVKARQPDEIPQVYTLSFEDSRCQNESLVGGKGASLAELTSIETSKFVVPKGFCVTAHALESHIKYHAKLEEAIDEFVTICSSGKIGNLREYCQSIVELMENTPVLHTVQNEILDSLKSLEYSDRQVMYAVRSSAVGEDSEDTSAAGQNSTFLGIKESGQVVKYVAHCWASLYTHQSVEYRRQHGMPIRAAMGVCVQQMVDAEAAGVMFTRHPITGNPKEILITSNYGLGEAVVSALVDPDTLMIERSRSDTLSLKSSTIGKKSQKVSLTSDGGTHCLGLSRHERDELSVSLELAMRLAHVGVSLDKLYGAPRDIEWAVVKDQVYLLQSRPVTALDTWTDFELTHELGSGVPSDYDIFTFANVGEVLSTAITPLTMSSVVHGLNISTETNLHRKAVEKLYTTHMFISNMRCTLNYMNLLFRFVEEKISLSNRVTEIAVCGRSILTLEIHERIKKRNGVMNLSARLNLTKQMLTDLWKNLETVERAENVVAQYKKKQESLKGRKRSTKEMYKMLEEAIKELTAVGVSHSHTSKCSIFYQVLMMSILSEGSEELSMEHYSDIALLLGSCSDVISAQVPVVLKEITRTIRESGVGEQFKSLEPTEAMDWLKVNCPKAHEQVLNFVKVHGHRGIEEFDLITETWGMKPEKFLATIQSMLKTKSDIEEGSSKDLTAAETVARLKTPRKSSTRFVLRMLLPATRKAVARRETTKALLIEMVHNLRMGYRRLAERLANEGRLPDPSLIFFLTHNELAELLDKPAPALIRKAVRRRKIRPKLLGYKYHEINYGLPRPVELTKLDAPRGTGVRVQGTSVCNGEVTGRACVALTLEEAAGIQSGDILITNATDIGWSPYFPLLGGVVTELGGLISHGAVVAREYGLPCIVGVENATRIFKTGDTVTLNGYTGSIEIVETDVKEAP